MTRTPAVLGGSPAFDPPLPFFRPSLPPLERVFRRLEPSYSRGVITNGPLVRELEERVADTIGVAHVVAVSSCTTGLMLCQQAFRILDGVHRVVAPSFTFSASGLSALWNGLELALAECNRATYQLDVADARDRLEPGSLLQPTHVFGAVGPVAEYADLAGAAGVPVLYDAAHALGAHQGGRAAGTFGDAEVFSLSPTKPVVAGEGGLVATGRSDVAQHVRLGRDYGNPGDYNTRFPGVNGRMSELHAAVALESLAELPHNLDRRDQLVSAYTGLLAEMPGISLPSVSPDDRATWKDFTVSVEAELGLERHTLVTALAAEGIDVRLYFSPPLHRQQAFAEVATGELPVTDDVAERVVSLPLFPSMTIAAAETVAQVIASIHAHAEPISALG